MKTLQVPGGDGAAVAATGRMAEGFEAEQSDCLGHRAGELHPSGI